MFRKFKKRHPNEYSLVTAAAVITFWRGLWNLQNEYLFPDNPLLSNGISIVFGLLWLWLNDFSFDEFADRVDGFKK